MFIKLVIAGTAPISDYFASMGFVSSVSRIDGDEKYVGLLAVIDYDLYSPNPETSWNAVSTELYFTYNSFLGQYTYGDDDGLLSGAFEATLELEPPVNIGSFVSFDIFRAQFGAAISADITIDVYAKYASEDEWQLSGSGTMSSGSQEGSIALTYPGGQSFWKYLQRATAVTSSGVLPIAVSSHTIDSSASTTGYSYGHATENGGVVYLTTYLPSSDGNGNYSPVCTTVAIDPSDAGSATVVADDLQLDYDTGGSYYDSRVIAVAADGLTVWVQLSSTTLYQFTLATAFKFDNYTLHSSATLSEEFSYGGTYYDGSFYVWSSSGDSIVQITPNTAGTLADGVTETTVVSGIAALGISDIKGMTVINSGAAVLCWGGLDIGVEDIQNPGNAFSFIANLTTSGDFTTFTPETGEDSAIVGVTLGTAPYLDAADHGLSTRRNWNSVSADYDVVVDEIQTQSDWSFDVSV